MSCPRSHLDRRGFLRILGGGLAGAALGEGCGRASRAAAPAETARGLVLGPGSLSGPSGSRYHLALLELGRPEPSARAIELEFMAHGVVLDPLERQRALLFEKRGRGACEVDLERGVVRRSLEPSPGSEFYGHGVFSTDGALLLATETEVEHGYRGKIVVRDGRSLAVRGEFPSFGESPHDCSLADGGRVLWVTNGGARAPGGSAPCVCAIDLASQRLLERLELDSPALGAGHLALSRRGDLAVACSSREWMARDATSALCLRPSGGALRTMVEPVERCARMLGETLSLAIHEPSRVVAVTHPRGHMVTFWDLERASLLAVLELAWPRGVTLTPSGDRFLLSHGASGRLLPVHAESYEPLPEEEPPAGGMNGSHLFLQPWQMPAAV